MNTFLLLLEEHFECRNVTVTEYSYTLVLLLLLKYNIWVLLLLLKYKIWVLLLLLKIWVLLLLLKIWVLLRVIFFSHHPLCYVALSEHIERIYCLLPPEVDLHHLLFTHRTTLSLPLPQLHTVCPSAKVRAYLSLYISYSEDSRIERDEPLCDGLTCRAAHSDMCSLPWTRPRTRSSGSVLIPTQSHGISCYSHEINVIYWFVSHRTIWNAMYFYW